MKPHEKESLPGYRSLDTGLIEERFRPEEGYDAYVGRVARGFGVSSAGQGVGRVRRRLGYLPYGRRYVKPVVAGLAAAAVTCAFRPALPALEGLPALLIFAPLALTVFFAVLCSLGLSPGDRRFLASFRGAVRRTLRRGWVT